MDQRDFQLNVGRQVRLHRKAQGLSQERLAELAEVHPTFISNIERGKVSASAFSLYKIAQALQVSFVDVIPSAPGFEVAPDYDTVDIISRIKKLENPQRSLYLAAIKGMLPK
ncbi:helix-turn-helix domain-containing protein [Pelotalea chapellei]|uniref:Helix-turn-helix domain-containing protein n=1 Tax=Pelotalea chapellei TaxID=44671 RepID=A0ABS5U3R3_9BACT|nr:helix-turn-helix transcriptional regulator [Pelotalea chapellei]MBT1070311.1 helix-turn-helix domain-containing protein [Pelotalea chapellei]